MSTSPSFRPRVAVVTVSYGSGDVLPAFLDSIPDAVTGDIEVVVADNKANGPEDVAALVAQHGARHVALPTNVGYGAAINAAVKSLDASVEWVLVSNPDLVMSAGAIDTLVATGDED